MYICNIEEIINDLASWQEIFFLLMNNKVIGGVITFDRHCEMVKLFIHVQSCKSSVPNKHDKS